MESEVNLKADFPGEENPSVSDENPSIASAISKSYDPANVKYEGEVAVYTDPSTGHQYTWDKDKEEWTYKTPAGTYGFEDDVHTYRDSDGVSYFWDTDKKAWFPKIDDDFMAQYQMSYGFVDNTTTSKIEPAVVKVEKKPPKEAGIKRKPSEAQWFEPETLENTKVYVSNLPTDITEEEFLDLMQKCGIVMRDTVTNNMRIKLYKESDSETLKGDGLCTYVRIESVELALKLLDGYELRGKKVKVEQAKFELKGSYDPTKKPKSKKRKEKQKLKKLQEKMFDWRPEKVVGERAKHERIVIVKNLFESKMFDEDVGLILEFQQDLREECAKCGEVKKVTLFDRHPEGIAQINMSQPEEADAVVTLLNGRWFGKRKLTAEIWDGRTKYKVQETDSQITERLSGWDKFLEEGEDSVSKKEKETVGKERIEKEVKKTMEKETNEKDVVEVVKERIEATKVESYEENDD